MSTKTSPPRLSYVPGLAVVEGIELIEEVAVGGMGSIWRAHHRRLGTDVAVKLIRTEMADETARTRLFIEARATARLRSPHVVRVFDCGETAKGDAFIVMELLEGETVADRLEWQGRFEPPAIIEIARQAASALDEAHAAGIIHRDVKPENIWLLPEEGQIFVKLLDFGIARASAFSRSTGKVTQSGLIVGTPAYMSPERFLTPDTVDKGCDIWSLAATTYEMLTERVPFDGETPAAVLAAIVQRRFPPASRVVDLPPAVDAVFETAFADDPAERFATAGAFVTALRRALESRNPTAVVAPPASEHPPAVSERPLSGSFSGPLSGPPLSERPVSEPPISEPPFRTDAPVEIDDPRPPSILPKRRSLAAVLVALVVLLGGGTLALQQMARDDLPAASRGLLGPLTGAVPPVFDPEALHTAPTVSPAPEPERAEPARRPTPTPRVVPPVAPRPAPPISERSDYGF